MGVLVGRPRKPIRLILTPHMLDYLQRCCDDPTMGMVLTDRSGPQRIDLRVDIVRELLRMARFGKGLATLSARPFTERSAAAKRASETRWSRVRARKRAVLATSQNTNPEEIKKTDGTGSAT